MHLIEGIREYCRKLAVPLFRRIVNWLIAIFNKKITSAYQLVKQDWLHFDKGEEPMAILLITLTIFILFGLPALLVISACIGASRSSRAEETLYL